MTDDAQVLLWRHGRHDRGRLQVDGTDRFPVEAVAERLRETLTVDPEVVLTHVFHARTPEARATARVVQDVWAGREPFRGRRLADGPRVEPESDVVPPGWARRSSTTRTLRITWEETDLLDPHGPAVSGTVQLNRVAERVRRESAPGRAVAVIGHCPQLEQLGTLLQRWSWWRRPRAWRTGAAIGHAEVVCLQGRVPSRCGRPWNARLAWQIAPDDRAAEELIREKVKSKMEAAKQLSAVLTLLLTVLLGVLLKESDWDGLAGVEVPLLGGPSLSAQVAVQVAVVLLLVALALYLAAMYAYDSLLMPSRFWVAGRPDRPPPPWLPARPPGSTAWVLNRNMQRVWAWLFQPATLLVGVAFVVVAVPGMRIEGAGQYLLLAALVGTGVVVWRVRPVLGSTD